MSSTLLIENSINNLNNFLNDIVSNNNTYYCWVGKTTPWANDLSPDLPNSSYEVLTTMYHDIVYGKLIANTNISPLTKYIPWTTNTVFSQYDPNDSNYFNENFYTVTSDFSVYKCIDNNEGANSTISPSLKLTSGCFQTSDGYTWKYMFTIPSAANSTFTTNKFIPITSNASVTSGAVPGTIDVIRSTNKGLNYQPFNEGTISYVASPINIQLANTASSVDNFYAGCSLYLKSGLGAGQISTIVSYNGATQIATVNPPFNTSIITEITSSAGVVANGQTIQQYFQNISYLYANGYFNVNDTLVQSDTGYYGTIGAFNSSSVVLINNSNTNLMSNGTPSYAFYDNNNTGSVLTGNVSIVAGSNGIVAAGANLQAILSVGKFIRVGTSPSITNASNYSNIRRVTSVTSAALANVDIAFANTITNTNIYWMPNAAIPVAAIPNAANGNIINTNLNAVTLGFSNVSSTSLSFQLGEVIKEYSNVGVDLGANGFVSYVNNNTLILSNINGTFSLNNFLVGQSSNLQAQTSTIVTNPTLTIGNINGIFDVGYPILTYDLGNPTSVGSFTPTSITYIPSNEVEYIVSPTININGDGTGALAYCVVNTALNSIFEITNIVPINVGKNYTYANVSIISSPGFGSNATAEAIISPVSGHGADAVTELGATWAGISVFFDTAQNEIYKFPGYGNYRRIGIIKNPLFNDLGLNITPTTRNNVTISALTTPFTSKEILYQASPNAAIRFLNGNSSMMQVDSISGPYTTGTIRGLSSNATATISLINALPFTLTGSQTIYDSNTGSKGILYSVANTSYINLTNTGGKLYQGDIIYDPSVNSYANIVSLYTSNNTINISTTYGLRFNQAARITLSSNIGSFTVGEKVIQQTSSAGGLIIDNSHELDISYTLISGSITSNLLLRGPSGNGMITFVNSSFIRLTGLNGVLNVSDTVNCISGNATVTATYPVLIVGDTSNNFSSGVNVISGLTSGAEGISTILNTIINPDLVRNTGTPIYINNIAPFTANSSTKETFMTVIQF